MIRKKNFLTESCQHGLTDATMCRQVVTQRLRDIAWVLALFSGRRLRAYVRPRLVSSGMHVAQTVTGNAFASSITASETFPEFLKTWNDPSRAKRTKMGIYLIANPELPSQLLTLDSK